MTDHRPRRPWLAALLALVVSGLGHAYLRRWARALGWYVAVTATVVLFVPESALADAFAGDPPAVVDVAPAVAVVAASVVDAYVLAVRTNRQSERGSRADATSEKAGASATSSPEPNAAATDGEREADETVRCPECGRDADAAYDFCQWCAEPLPGRGAE